MNSLDTFRAAMARAGLNYSGPISADGKLHRFKAAGDRGRNSWYVLHAEPPAGAFGCWKRQIQDTFCERQPDDCTGSEGRAIRELWKRAEAERKRNEKQRREKAKKTAAWILRRSKPLTTHRYLMSKGVQSYGDACEYRGAIVLPLREIDGTLQTLQFIDADASKKFLTDGRVRGCCFTVSDNTDGPLVLCEGYATGASIHAATGYAVICAMNCGNLTPVAAAARKVWPKRDIFLAADNDEWTDGNPGLTEATAAAKAIRARLAIPQFCNRASKPTDFNDLHQLEGINAVKSQIQLAESQKESEGEAFARLAALSPTDYDRHRVEEAEARSIRVSTLDREVARLRDGADSTTSTLQGRAVNLPNVEPWPQPVNGAEVLNAIATTFARYVALPPGAADAMALWAAHTHCFDAFAVTPRLNINSPEKGCGKTTARDVVALFVSRPLPTENLTGPVLFRLVNAQKPTVLADEYDSWLGENNELRGMLNAGHRRGGQAMRCEGDNHEVRAFEVFAPAVLCGIGPLPATLHDRSIIIRLTKAKRGELSARFDSRRVKSELELCRKLARWTADSRTILEASDPKLPNDAFNRLADNWRPLFAIAETAGADWPHRAAAAFAALTTKNDIDSQGLGIMLLCDIQQVLAERQISRIFSCDLIAALTGMKDRPWPDTNHGRAITESWLAKRLRVFNIQPKTMRVGDQRLKGYETSDFRDAFDRYLPEAGFSNRDAVTTEDFAGETNAHESVTENSPVTPAHPGETSVLEGLSRCHGSNPAELLI